MHYSDNLLGGVKFDVSPQQADAIRKGVDFLEERNHFYMKVVTPDESLPARTRNVGLMTQEQVVKVGAVGPSGRALGLDLDIRTAAPYAAYADIPVNVITHTGGDLAARYMVRINELFESYRLIRKILDKLPQRDGALY